MIPAQLEEKHMIKLAEFGTTEIADSKFVYYLLDALYDKEELKSSSFRGSKSNFNGICHEQLDPMRLSIIEGMYYILYV